MVRLDICELNLRKKLRERTDLNQDHAVIIDDFRRKNNIKSIRNRRKKGLSFVSNSKQQEKKNLKKKSSNYTQVEASLFPKIYSRGGLPCTIAHKAGGFALSWSCPIEELDYEHYLPIFMDGVRCVRHPYKFIAREAGKFSHFLLNK